MRIILKLANNSCSLIKGVLYSISTRNVPQNLGHIRPLKIALSDVPESLKYTFNSLFHAIQTSDFQELNRARHDINLTTRTCINKRDGIFLHNLLLEGLWKLSMK